MVQPEDTEVHMVGMQAMGSRPGDTRITATKATTTQATATKAMAHSEATAKATASKATPTQATEAIMVTQDGQPLPLAGMQALDSLAETQLQLALSALVLLELAALDLLDLMALLALLVLLGLLDFLALLLLLDLLDLLALLALLPVLDLDLPHLDLLALLAHLVVHNLSEVPLRSEVRKPIAATFIGRQLGITHRPKHLDYGMTRFGDDIHGVYIWLTLIHGRHNLLTKSKAAQ